MHQFPLEVVVAEPIRTANVLGSLLSAPAADAAGTFYPLIPSAYLADALTDLENPYKTPPKCNPSSIVDFYY